MKHLVLLCSLLAPRLAVATDPSPTKIGFTIDCMIHDAEGKMLADLGSVGTLMNGNYQGAAEFAFGDMRVSADLNGPFKTAPEVASPQLKLTIFKNGAPVASVITSAVPGVNAALWEPTENFYLHCDEMKMGH